LFAGIHYIAYLDPGNYHCIDRDEYSLRAGIEYEIPLHDLTSKRPHIIWDSTFDLNKFKNNSRFDVVTAMAVFFHLEMGQQVSQ
jgi:hypothetical protein